MTDAQKTELGSADILRILELLPHRYPFLLVASLNFLGVLDTLRQMPLVLPQHPAVLLTVVP